jgi:hypothetical protein
MPTAECDVDHCTLLWFGRVTAHQCRGTYVLTEQFRDLALSNRSLALNRGCS